MKKALLVLVCSWLFVSAQVVAGDVAAGKAKSAQCAACHGAKGISPMGLYPNLAGQKGQYTAKQLNDFRSGARKDPTMQAMVASLSDDDVANLSAYYASIK
jgi:cytochrome c553